MEAYLDARRLREPQWLVMVTSIASSLLIFWWYWADSNLRSYRRSPGLNIAVVAVGFLAVPYYLLRSRGKGERLAAFARLLGFVVLMVGAVLLGSLPMGSGANWF
jgi:hypothetical protein